MADEKAQVSDTPPMRDHLAMKLGEQWRKTQTGEPAPGRSKFIRKVEAAFIYSHDAIFE